MKMLSPFETHQISGGLAMNGKEYTLDMTGTHENCQSLFVLKVEASVWLAKNPAVSLVMDLLNNSIHTAVCNAEVDMLTNRFFALAMTELHFSSVAPSTAG